MAKSKIEWTERTINVFRGCTRVSEGCRNCYAERLAARFATEGNPYEGYAGFVQTKNGKQPRWTGKVEVIEKMMDAPLNIKQNSLIFINSMSDTFHEDIPDEAIIRLFEVMELCNGNYTYAHHHFQILTKRPQRMLEMWKSGKLRYSRNIWMGVSVEDVATVQRCEIFKDMGARVQWVSAEPLLEDISEAIESYLPYVDWLVCGGESGPRARPMQPQWAWNLYMATASYGTRYFFKQHGGRKDKGAKVLYNPYPQNDDKVPVPNEYPFGWKFDE